MSLRAGHKQLILDLHQKLIVDLFAGGGGMSVAFERAFGRSPDIAINHSDDALSMHRANHPLTRHFIADVYEVCPRGATQGRPVGWLHLSPDCTHHSQASGGQPRSKKIRGLAWVGKRWAGQVLPDVISLENVKQILKWGPLIAKRDPATGRCLKRTVQTIDGKEKASWEVAARGERVPVQDQYLVPDPRREGQTWRAFVAALHALGYAVEWRVLCAADFGGHTTRERLFMIARRDGQRIEWPEQTHFKVPTGKQQKWKPAADCIDWQLDCPSIFERKRPLAPATLRRIAKGVKRYVLDNAQPFIVPLTHRDSGDRSRDIREPLPTITAAHRGEMAIVAPTLVQTGYGERDGQSPRALDIEAPLGTCVGTGKHALAAAYLMQANDGFNTTPGRAADEPFSTITNSGSQQQLVTCTLAPDDEAGALRVAAFLMEYYGEGGQWSELDKPLNTITTRDRLALVTVHLQGTPYVIVDIGLRMLAPRELFRGQDFPDDYIIDRGHDGRVFSKSAQVRMCGNSVDPVMAQAFLAANAPWLAIRRSAA